MATIRNRNGRWHVQVRKTGSTSINRTFSLKSDAQFWAREKERELELEGYVKPNTELLSHRLIDLLSRYETEVARTKKSYHVEKYYLRILCEQNFANMQLHQIKSSDFQVWINQRLNTHRPSSIIRVAGMITRVFNTAIKFWGYPLVENPMARVVIPRAEITPIKRIPSEIIATLNRPQTKIGQIALFALETGMRRSEIASLKIQDVNLDAALAHVTHSKNGFARYVPMSRKAIAAINSSSVSDGLVFGMSSNAIRLAWDRYKNHHNIENLRFHDLRHEAISQMFEKGLTVAEVSMISGHRTVSQLFRYAHADIVKLGEKLN